MMDSFLGRGWGFPPAFDRRNARVETASEEEDVFQSLRILLSTDIGERVMRPDYGCDLNRFLFGAVDQGMLTRIKNMISDAILYHEPRVTLDEIDISENESMAGLLLIRIDYTIRTTNSRFNMVYPFYINEAAHPGA
ncbi:MAG: GPW/gp25 family protein [Desulfobacterales bacterium]|nr:GPW/gp25 family protein [Desulfobacterales bacterium]